MIKITDQTSPRTFTITNNPSSSVNFLEIIRKYSSLRPIHAGTPRFFLQYIAGKCSIQVVGANTFGKIPSRIAAYLNKPDYKLYTGHCFKSTAVSFKTNFNFMSLYHDRMSQGPQSDRQIPSSSAQQSSLNVMNEGNDMCERSDDVGMVKVEPNSIVMEDAVVQYLRNEQLNN